MDIYKKTKLATFVMMAGVGLMGIAALIISERHGYGASSEAKMNFLRLVIFIVSLTQVVMAAALKKIISASRKEEHFFAAQMTANALCEAPAAFGLILVFISKTFMDFVILGAVSLLAFIALFPKQIPQNKS